MGVKDKTLISDYHLESSLPFNTFHEYFLDRCNTLSLEGRTEALLDVKNEKQFNFSDFEPLSRRFGSYFYQNGMIRGETVIYTSQNCGILYALILGIWRANGCVRALYTEELAETVVQKAREMNSKWIVCDPDMALRIKMLNVESIELIVMEDGFESLTSINDLLKYNGETLPEIEVTSDDIALIMPTSGTTGPSKGAQITHANLIWDALICKWLPFTRDLTEPLFWFGKPTHISGIQFSLLYLALGQVMHRSNYSEDIFFTAIDSKIKNLFLVTPLLTSLLTPEASKHDLSHLKIITCGGAILTETFCKKIKEVLPSVTQIGSIYGMTEASLFTSTRIPNQIQNCDLYDNCPLMTVGKVLPGIQLQVRDLTTGLPLGAMQKGEITVKSKSIFSSYYNNEEDTRKTILADGWIASGDYGYYDEDGFVFVLDRVKETFLCQIGNHISPSELESELLKHPLVGEACVIPEPFEQVGDPRGFVTLNKSVSFSDVPKCKIEALEEEIQNFANGNLADYKHLKGGVIILKELPKGVTGKVTRRHLANYKKQ